MEQDLITLFKVRNFSDYLNDTFTFIKVEGKSFYSTLFKYYGWYFIALMLCMYLLIDLFYNSASTQNVDAVSMFIDNNFAITVLLVLSTIVVSLIFFAIILSYPVFYLMDMVKNSTKKRDIPLLRKQVKQSIKRGVGFILLSCITVLPVVLIAYSLSAVLIFLIVGIPLLFAIGPLSFSIIALAYYDYVVNKNTFFSSYSKAFTLLKVDFWGILGNSFILLIIMQIIGYVAIWLPNIISMIGLFTSTYNEYEITELGWYKVVIALMIIIGSLVSSLFYTVFLVNQGLVYYSSRECLESYQSMLDIESIGQNND